MLETESNECVNKVFSKGEIVFGHESSSILEKLMRY